MLVINLTLSALLVRLRENTTFGIKDEIVFFTFVTSLMHFSLVAAVKLCGLYASVCSFFFVLFHISHLYQIFLITSVTMCQFPLPEFRSSFSLCPFYFASGSKHCILHFFSSPVISCKQLSLCKFHFKAPFSFLKISA